MLHFFQSNNWCKNYFKKDILNIVCIILLCIWSVVKNAVLCVNKPQINVFFLI